MCLPACSAAMSRRSRKKPPKAMLVVVLVVDRARRISGRCGGIWASPSGPVSRWSRISTTCARMPDATVTLWLVRGLGHGDAAGRHDRDLRHAVARRYADHAPRPAGARVPSRVGGGDRAFTRRSITGCCRRSRRRSCCWSRFRSSCSGCSRAASERRASGSAPASTSTSSCWTLVASETLRRDTLRPLPAGAAGRACPDPWSPTCSACCGWSSSCRFRPRRCCSRAKAGLEVPVDEDLAASLDERRYLHQSIGTVGLLALRAAAGHESSRHVAPPSVAAGARAMTQIERRTLLLAGLGLALRQTDPASSRPKVGDLFVKPGDAARTPLTPGDIPLGAAADAGLADGSVGRHRPQRLAAESGDPASARSGHAEPGDPRRGRRTASSRIRPSARTPAATSTTGEPTARLLACQCHFSQFDPSDGAKVVDGPAPRPLPALPLKIVDGKLAVAQPFTAPIGFEKG